LRKFKPHIEDFLATVLVFKLHIFSHDSSVAFASYQSDKVRNTLSVAAEGDGTNGAPAPGI